MVLYNWKLALWNTENMDHDIKITNVVTELHVIDVTTEACIVVIHWNIVIHVPNHG